MIRIWEAPDQTYRFTGMQRFALPFHQFIAVAVMYIQSRIQFVSAKISYFRDRFNGHTGIKQWTERRITAIDIGANAPSCSLPAVRVIFFSISFAYFLINFSSAAFSSALTNRSTVM